MKGTKRKVFCSDKCRVYWNREKGPEPEIGQDAVVGEVGMVEVPVAAVLSEVAAEDLVVEAPGRHPKWAEGDPKEGSLAFYMKYGVYGYDEME